MSIVKKSSNYNSISPYIKEAKISGKSQKLLEYLFNGDAQKAAKILKNFSFMATSDVTMVLIPAGILMCAFKQKYKHIDDRGLKGSMDRTFKAMGEGNGREAKFNISDYFLDTVKFVLSYDSSITESKKNSIANNLKKRIGKISEWKHSAKKIENNIIPALEKVVANGLCAAFDIAFQNKGKSFIEKLDSVQDVSSGTRWDGSAFSVLTEHGSVILETVEKFIEKEIDMYCKFKSSSGYASYVQIVKKHGEGGWHDDNKKYKLKMASNAKQFPVKLYYHVNSYAYLDFSPIVVNLEEGEVLRVLRTTAGDPKKCADLLCGYIKKQLPEVKAKIEQVRKKGEQDEEERRRKQEEEEKWKREQEEQQYYGKSAGGNQEPYLFESLKQELDRLEKEKDYSEDSIKKLRAIYEENEENFKTELAYTPEEERKVLGKRLTKYLLAAKKESADFQFLEENIVRLRNAIVNI